MCTGLELLGLAGAAASTVGGVITAKEQEKNAQRQADARNEKLRGTLLKNDQLAQQSRDEFNARQKEIQPEQTDQALEKAKAEREADLVKAADATPEPDVTLSGSAPTVVKTDLAKRMADAMTKAKGQAKSQAKLAGYGDMWLDQGFKDTEAGRGIAQDANFAAGNLAILPYQQDIAEQHATKPISPIGGLLQGFGSLASSYAGGGGAVPKKRYTSPWMA